MNLRKMLLMSVILIAGFAGMSLTNATSLPATTSCGTAATCDDIVIHTVVKGETVYSIAAAYNTTVQQIYILNPDAKRGIKAGDKLRILKAKAISGYSNHVIEAKETLYSVSRMYGITVDDVKNANPGLSETTFNTGKTIAIPHFGAVATSVNDVKNANPGLAGAPASSSAKEPQLAVTSRGEVVRIGIFFSFTDDGSSIPKDKIAEYYEGFLLAVRDLKEKGLNAEIYTFDLGPEYSTAKLESLFGTTEVENLDLMIGGVSQPQINALAMFSKKMGIKYVIPFGATGEIENNPGLFRMTTSHSSLYPEIVSAFTDRFKDYTVIFVTGSLNDKSDFVAGLKNGLSAKGIQYRTVPDSDNLQNDLKAVLGTGKNMLIPVSSTEPTLRKLIHTADALGTTSISLFGYPEWQAYKQHTAALHKYDSYIYSIFFLDEQQKDVQDVANEYRQWYGKSMAGTFPRWGYLGYDTGLYFLTTLFESNLADMKVRTLQSAINPERAGRNEQAGYVNNGLYFVHYKPGTGVEKIEINR